MSFELIPTPSFEKELKKLVKKYPSIKSDIADLGKQLLSNPSTGKPIGNNCYKIRMAISAKGTGKSGGARVITYVKIVQEKIFLFSIYDKGEQETITEKEIEQLLKRL